MAPKTHPTKKIETNLANIRGGKLLATFDAELKKVAENINDLNTNPTATREITLKIKLKPSQGRSEVAATATVTTKLAGRRELEATFVTAIGADGEPRIAEQMNLEDLDVMRPVIAANLTDI